jgi:flagellin
MTHSSVALSTFLSSSSAASLPAITFVFATSGGTSVSSELSVDYTSGVITVTDLTASDGGASTATTLTITSSSIDVVVDLTAADSVGEVAGYIDTVLSSSTFLASLSVDTTHESNGILTISDPNTAVTGGGLSSVSNARSLITTLDGVLENLNQQRAELGSYSNRLDSTVSNLTNISSNLEAGRGRIEDADFAAETTALAKSQILQQASTAMLAQANASKQNVLSLLQG